MKTFFVVAFVLSSSPAIAADVGAEPPMPTAPVAPMPPQAPAQTQPAPQQKEEPSFLSMILHEMLGDLIRVGNHVGQTGGQSLARGWNSPTRDSPQAASNCGQHSTFTAPGVRADLNSTCH